MSLKLFWRKDYHHNVKNIRSCGQQQDTHFKNSKLSNILCRLYDYDGVHYMAVIIPVIAQRCRDSPGELL